MSEKYQWTDDMGEVSGFGGGYEQTCRTMIINGLTFWDEQPQGFDPKYQGMQGVYGLLLVDNEDAKALDEAMVSGLAEEDGPTGAMHHACVQHIFAARRLGWAGYQQEMRNRSEDDE